MNVMWKRVAIAVVLSVAALAAPTGKIRTHYVIVDKHRAARFTGTAISDFGSETFTSETYLLEDSAGQKLRIDLSTDYSRGRTTAEYRVNEGQPIRVTLELPGSATTRKGRIKEAKEHPELMRADVPITVESPGGSLKFTEREWQGSAALHATVRAAIGSAFVTSLSSFRFALGYPDFMGACSTYSIVTGESCAASTELGIAETRADCAFDASFDEPCSAEQKQRAKKQGVNGEPIGRY